MRRGFHLLGTTLALSMVAAPDATAQDLEAKKAAALDRPFLGNAPWISDFGRAKQQAAASGQLIFGYFSRSYAP